MKFAFILAEKAGPRSPCASEAGTVIGSRSRSTRYVDPHGSGIFTGCPFDIETSASCLILSSSRSVRFSMVLSCSRKPGHFLTNTSAVSVMVFRRGGHLVHGEFVLRQFTLATELDEVEPELREFLVRDGLFATRVLVDDHEPRIAELSARELLLSERREVRLAEELRAERDAIESHHGHRCIRIERIWRRGLVDRLHRWPGRRMAEQLEQVGADRVADGARGRDIDPRASSDPSSHMPHRRAARCGRARSATARVRAPTPRRSRQARRRTVPTRR
jgi:hypothetical protein